MVIEKEQEVFDIQVPDFNTLNALYHQNGYPVFEITELMMKNAGWFGATITANEAKIELFKEIYGSLANRVRVFKILCQ